MIGTVSLFFATWWAPFVAVAASDVTFGFLSSSVVNPCLEPLPTRKERSLPMNQKETAVEIVREAILQGLSIATTVASELRGFGLDDAEREWALEFTLAKLAVLSVRAESLTDAALRAALVGEIELFVNRRATLDATVLLGFQSYGRIVRENDAPSVPFAQAMGSLFQQRLNKTLLALPTAGMIRPTDNECLVSSSIAADCCWPLKNPTEASVF